MGCGHWQRQGWDLSWRWPWIRSQPCHPRKTKLFRAASCDNCQTPGQEQHAVMSAHLARCIALPASTQGQQHGQSAYGKWRLPASDDTEVVVLTRQMRTQANFAWYACCDAARCIRHFANAMRLTGHRSIQASVTNLGVTKHAAHHVDRSQKSVARSCLTFTTCSAQQIPRNL